MEKKLISLYCDDYYRLRDNFPLLVRRIDGQDPVRMHTHDFVELVVISDGEGEHMLPGGGSMVRRGDVFVIPRGIAHGYRIPPNGRLSLFNMLFSPEKLPIPQLELAQQPGFRKLFMPSSDSPVVMFHVDDKEIDSLVGPLNELLEECRTPRPASRTCRLALTLLLMCRLTRLYPGQCCGEEYLRETSMNSILEYLYANSQSTPTIAALAKRAGMSRTSFMKFFRIATGTSPLQYLLMLRLNQACHDLVSTSLPVSQIAFDAGFNDSNYFTQLFRKHLGTTPREYRCRHTAVR